METQAPRLEEPTRRALIAGAAGLAFGAGLVGCARDAERPLSFWAMSYEGDYAPHLLADFTARTGLAAEAQTVPSTAAHEKLLTAFAGGALPDVFMLYNSWIGEFAAIGAIATVPDAALLADLVPGIRAATQVRGRDYAVPWAVAPYAQFYRRDIVARAGYDTPPTDWAGWRDMARRIKRQRPDDYVFLMLLNWPTALITLLTQNGAAMLRDQNTRGAFQMPAVAEAFAFYASLFAEGLAPRALSTEVQDPLAAFAQGRFAIWPSGPTTMTDFHRRSAEIPPDLWGTAILAGPHGPAPMSGESSSLCVATTTRRPAEAWALLRHLASVPSELRFQQMIGVLPARASAWASPQMAAPVLAPFAAQLRRPAHGPKVIEWERIMAEVQFAAERVVRGVQTIPQALAALDTRVDALLAKRRALVDAGRIA